MGSGWGKGDLSVHAVDCLANNIRVERHGRDKSMGRLNSERGHRARKARKGQGGYKKPWRGSKVRGKTRPSGELIAQGLHTSGGTSDKIASLGSGNRAKRIQVSRTKCDHRYCKVGFSGSGLFRRAPSNAGNKELGVAQGREIVTSHITWLCRTHGCQHRAWYHLCLPRPPRPPAIRK